MRTSRIKSTLRAFSLVELMVSVSLSAVIMAGVLSSVVAMTKSSLRLADYSKMEDQSMRALEMLARDVRMAQNIATLVPSNVSWNQRFYPGGVEVLMQQITLTIPNSTNTSTYTVVYAFSGSTFTRTTGGVTTTLISDIQSSTAKFIPYNLANFGTTKVIAASDLETQQILIYMTISPSALGNYVAASKRVISARFVLRNKGSPT